MSTDPAHFADVAETHVSTVFFSGDRAYKLLKPVTTGFLDHSDPKVRIRAVDREIELNRRLAPDVYLGAADVVENNEIVDRFIVMRRLESHSRLSGLVDTPEFESSCRDVVKRVASFHEGLDPITDPNGPASRDFVASLWNRSLDEMNDDVVEMGLQDQHVDIADMARNYLAGRGALFEHRIEAGFQRDGHGDLLADDVFCLDDGPRILDCLAFRDDLRISDVLADVAFLAMDIERLAGADAGRTIIDDYRQFTNEHHPPSLEHHYIAYRAIVRSKIAAIKARLGMLGQREEAQKLHRMAVEHLRLGEVRLILVGGAPGTGKSTLASDVAEQYGWIVLTSDELRKDLAGVGHFEPVSSAPDEGLYSPKAVDETYRALLGQAQSLLEMGRSVVLDASWTSFEHRQWAAEVARTTTSRLSAIECVLDPATAAERVSRRLATLATSSDATPAIAKLLATRRDPWPDAIHADTEGPVESVAALVTMALDRPGELQ